MIIAYALTPHDSGAHMLGPDTFRPEEAGGFYDWRFGRDGVAHPATCSRCGRKTDRNYVNGKFRAEKRAWDVSATYDGYCIVSQRFRQFSEQRAWEGMEFVALPSDPEFFILRLNNVLRFDSCRRKTRFERPCSQCNAYFDVVGGTPAYLSGVPEPLDEGFYRTDLEFGSGHEQAPMILVGVGTASLLKAGRFRNFDLHAVTA